MERLEITRADLVERLAAHKLLGKAPRNELEWLAEHGELRRYTPDVDSVIGKGQRVAEFFAVIAGRFSFYVDRGTGPRKVTEWRTGDLMGLLPYSRLDYSPGVSHTDEVSDVFALAREHLAEMIHVCPSVTTACVHVMLDRARIFNSSELQDEKMISLGRLSAGLAHELNNPASAAARSSRLLADAVIDAETSSRRLGSLGLSELQLTAIDSVRDACLASAAPLALSPLERADREDEIADWLERHGSAVDCAMALGETAVTLETLDELAGVVSGEPLSVALHWIAAGCAARSLAREVEKSTTRIHELVGAVKRFTHLDQPLVSEPLDVEQGLRDTFTMLGAKARDKDISVRLDIGAGAPRARVSAEINQVWTNLIDNALDAAPREGSVSVTVRGEAPWVVVRVIDNGHGIPADVRQRVFDPFFTTKPVGQGTGLGLDLARRILRQWGGELEFDSEPGRTEFRVRLPAEDSVGGQEAVSG